MEDPFLALFSAKPELDFYTRENLKKRILNHVSAEATEIRNADLLDRKIAGEEIPNSNGLIDFLASIAQTILELPRTLPRLAWREEARQNFQKSKPHFQLFSFLRQATAAAMLFVIVGVVSLTYFVAPTRTAVAQLSVESGTVQLRVADSNFFQNIEKMATIRLGDTIRVDADSTAQLAFYDDSKLHLAEETEMSITDFKPDFVSRGDSAVRVALLAGGIEADVEKNAAFEIETATSNVEATRAKFSVAIDPTTGSTKIKTDEEMVAVSSHQNSEMVALLAGESVIFAGEKEFSTPLIAAEAVFELPALEKLKTKIDLIKIRNFDALIAAQNDEDEVAHKILTTAEDSLTSLLFACDLTPTEGGKFSALEIFIRKNYPEGATREAVLQNLNQTVIVGKILNYYFVAPQKLRGVPAFEILARDRYAPTGQLRNLFATLRAGELAQTEIQPLVSELADKLTLELASGSDENKISVLLASMQNEPIFLPALRKLSEILPTTIRELVDVKIQQLEERVREYTDG